MALSVYVFEINLNVKIFFLGKIPITCRKLESFTPSCRIFLTEWLYKKFSLHFQMCKFQLEYIVLVRLLLPSGLWFCIHLYWDPSLLQYSVNNSVMFLDPRSKVKTTVYWGYKIHTYIHNWPLQSFSQDHGLASTHTIYVVYVNFIREWRDLQFNVDSELQIFEKLFHEAWILLSSSLESIREKSPT